MLDLLAVVYVVWVTAEGTSALDARCHRGRASVALVALLIAILSAARGAYIMLVEFPDRRVAQITIAERPTGAGRWRGPATSPPWQRVAGRPLTTLRATARASASPPSATSTWRRSRTEQLACPIAAWRFGRATASRPSETS